MILPLREAEAQAVNALGLTPAVLVDLDDWLRDHPDATIRQFLFALVVQLLRKRFVLWQPDMEARDARRLDP